MVYHSGGYHLTLRKISEIKRKDCACLVSLWSLQMELESAQQEPGVRARTQTLQNEHLCDLMLRPPASWKSTLSTPMCPREHWFGIRQLEWCLHFPAYWLPWFPSRLMWVKWTEVCRALHACPFPEAAGCRENSAGCVATKPPIPISVQTSSRPSSLCSSSANWGPCWPGRVVRFSDKAGPPAQAPVPMLSQHTPFHLILFF